MRSVAVVSVGRSDVGLYRPILREIASHPDLELRLYLSGAHLTPAYADQARALDAEFGVFERVDMLLASDSPEAIAKSIGLGVAGFAASFARSPPDILLVLGDRSEMFAPALAALPFRIPVAHVHGGELTSGATDDALRHSLTKLSHLHFVSHPAYARRVVQLGEEPWRVLHTGAPALDAIKAGQLPPGVDVIASLGLDPADAPLLVTFHPETLQAHRTHEHMDAVLSALTDAPQPIIFTMPNADVANAAIRDRIAEFVRVNPRARAVESLGEQRFFSLMTVAAAMVGNSSSGIIEAASFGLPVVNIGERQGGRERPANVIDTGHAAEDIAAAIQRAVSPAFREKCRTIENPYATGKAARSIVDVLATTPLDDRLLVKRFHDLKGVPTHG